MQKHKKPEKIIILGGGLGNILFQYNLGLFLEEQGFHVSYADNLLTRSFITDKILKWHTHQNRSKDIIKRNLITLPFLRLCWNLILMLLSKQFKHPFFGVYYDVHSNYEKSNKHVLASKYVYGYWQQKEWFTRKTLKEIKTQITANIENGSLIQPKWGVHIRRGDIGENCFVPTSFYHEAIKDCELKGLCFFTNDKNFVKEEFSEAINKGAAIAEQSSDWDDFLSLCSCSDGIICSNSTFSWWAATIANSKIKKVMAPKTAYNPVDFTIVESLLE